MTWGAWACRVKGIVAARLLELADGGTRLHGIGDEPVVDDFDAGDVVGLREGGVHGLLFAQVPVEAGVRGHVVVHQGAAVGNGLVHVDDGRQFLEIHRNLLGGVLGLTQRLGDDHRHRVADVAYLARGQHRMRRLGHGRAVLVVNLPTAGQAADLVGGDILAREHGDDPRRLGRGTGVDALDGGVGVGAAQDIGVGLARTVDVVRVCPLAGEKALVFLAENAGADSRFGHGPSSPSLRHRPSRP